MSLYETLPHEPQYVLEEAPEFYAQKMTFQTGDSQSWPRFHKPRRSWSLRWEVGNEEEQEAMKAFLKAHKGAATPFQWVRDTKNPLPRPYKPPIVETKTGGSTSLRSLYVGYTWSDGTNETPLSYRTQYITFPAGYTMVVTTQAFPENVTRAYVYVGTSLDYMIQQQTGGYIRDPDEGWAEPPAGAHSGGSNLLPPTTNEFTETVLVYAVEDTLETAKLTAKAWSLSVRVMEKFAG